MRIEYSVLMSVYKMTKQDELKLCMESVFAQDPAPTETVIVEDGPVPEDVQTYLHELAAEGKVKLVPLETNVGLGSALAEGTKHCNCEWIARMDADDICTHDRMQKQIAYLKEHPDVDVLGGQIAEFVDNKENIVSYRRVPIEHEKLCKYLKFRSPFNHVTVIMRKSMLQKAGGYQKMLLNEDIYLWARMFLAGAKFANLQDEIVFSRISEDLFRRRGGYQYYKNACAVLKYMYNNKILTYGEYLKAKTVRFAVQVLMPNSVRQWAYKTFARDKK